MDWFFGLVALFFFLFFLITLKIFFFSIITFYYFILITLFYFILFLSFYLFFSFSSEPCGGKGLGALARCQACFSEVGELSSGHWFTRDLRAPCSVKWQKHS